VRSRKRSGRKKRTARSPEHPGDLGSQDTYYIGNLKGVGRIYQQTFVDALTPTASWRS